MGVERVGVEAAKRLLDDGYRYVDVRTPEEYAAGHPVGARNVPCMLRVSGALADNPAFVPLMQARYGSDSRLVLGCASGQRSAVAASKLAEAGFTALVEMRPGYVGIRDPFGQVVEQGWAAAGLPTELTAASDC